MMLKVVTDYLFRWIRIVLWEGISLLRSFPKKKFWES